MAPFVSFPLIGGLLVCWFAGLLDREWFPIYPYKNQGSNSQTTNTNHQLRDTWVPAGSPIENRPKKGIKQRPCNQGSARLESRCRFLPSRPQALAHFFQITAQGPLLVQFKGSIVTCPNRFLIESKGLGTLLVAPPETRAPADFAESRIPSVSFGWKRTHPN